LLWWHCWDVGIGIQRVSHRCLPLMQLHGLLGPGVQLAMAWVPLLGHGQ